MSNFITYKYEEHLITLQNEAEAKFLAAFEEAKPALQEAHVVVNPYLINPLAAVILFKTASNVAPKMTIHGKRNSRENIEHTFAAATSHVLPVVGLYEGITKVTIEAGSESKTFEIQSAELPEVARCRNIMTSIDYFGTDIMIVSPADKNYAVGFDYKGDVRWLIGIPTMFDIKRLANGNIMTGSHRFMRMPYCPTGVMELTMSGKIVKEYRMPGNYHHDHWEMRDGNLMVASQDYSNGSTTIEDVVCLLDRNTGEVLQSWDLKDFLPQDEGKSGSWTAYDWFHINALWVNEDEKTMTLSGRHQDAIINFSYDGNGGKGKLNWIIGDPEGWSEKMQKYFFKPVGDVANFEWQRENHACVELPNGDIMAFDNGQFRSKDPAKYIKNKDNYSRGVRYRIDKEKMEIEQVWQFGKQWGQSFYSGYISNVEYYADGHYLVHSGGIGIAGGYASDVLPALVLFMPDGRDGIEDFDMCSKTIEEKDGTIMYYLETPGNFYRAERMALYYEGDHQPLGDGLIVGELDVTPEFGTIPEVDEVDGVIPRKHGIEISEEFDKLILSGSFPRGALAMWVIEGSKGDNHGYYINTAANKIMAMCSAAYLEADSDFQRFSITKFGLSGRYTIKVIIDDKKYNTGITFFA